MEINCALCRKPARMYCDSDDARLCWDCDEKVHGANFLVAKHSRTLLCHVCQSPTPWKASGTKLNPTISVCEGCFDNCKYDQIKNPAAAGRAQQPPPEEEDETDQTLGIDGGDIDTEIESSVAEDTDDDDVAVEGTEDEDDDDEEEEEEEEEIEEEDGDNQVVPWAASSPNSPSVSSAPPLTASSSSSEEQGSFSLKRSWSCRIPDSDDEDVCCSSQANSGMDVAPLRAAAKMARVEEDHRRMEFVGSLTSLREGSTAANGGGDRNDRSASMIVRRISELKAEMALE